MAIRVQEAYHTEEQMRRTGSAPCDGWYSTRNMKQVACSNTCKKDAQIFRVFVTTKRLLSKSPNAMQIKQSLAPVRDRPKILHALSV